MTDFPDPPLSEDNLRLYVLAVVRDVLTASRPEWRLADNDVERVSTDAVSAVFKVLRRAGINLTPKFREWP